jgi:hypothetical protein
MPHHYTLDQMDWPGILEYTGLSAEGVCHVGAHEGQEVELYRRLGFRSIILVEADPDLAAQLEGKYGHSRDVSVLPFAVGADRGCIP